MEISITVKDLSALRDNDGMTLEKGNKVNYRHGYQVATFGLKTRSVETAMRFIRACKGTCGIWLSNGIYYIDYSIYILDKKAAVRMAIEHNQQAIYDWSTGECIYL